MARRGGCLLSLLLLPSGASALRRDSRAVATSADSEEAQSLQAASQPHLVARDGRIGSSYTVKGHRDLVLMHVPYNFGHTVEKVAMMRKGVPNDDVWRYLSMSGDMFTAEQAIPWSAVGYFAKPRAEVWGHFHPDLMGINKQTGCNTYFSPQKYWPEELARSYFGNKTVFGLLRDPAERLVAFFRGNFAGYGGGFSQSYHDSCDVNSAVKQALKAFIASGDKFYQACTFVPQAEYFDGPHGITLPVDNRLFPSSMNAVFQAHGYEDMFIETDDVLHVRDCDHVWAADLDRETRALIRQVYARDYELLCKHFGYCDPDENTCIKGVPQMCPPSVLA